MRISVDGFDVLVYTGARTFDIARPSIVFVHGAALDHTVWILQSRYFAHHGYNSLAVDLPGHGRSAGEPQPTIAAMADWIPRCLDALGVASAAVVGHSMGALVALEAAAGHPQRFTAAALLGLAIPMAVSDALLDAARRNDHAAIDMITIWGHSTTAQVGGNTVPGQWMAGGSMRLLERARPGVLYNDLKACNEYASGAASLKKLGCPTLVLLGERDIMAPPKPVLALVNGHAKAYATVLPGCGHMLMAEQPDAVLDALRGLFGGA